MADSIPYPPKPTLTGYEALRKKIILEKNFLGQIRSRETASRNPLQPGEPTKPNRLPHAGAATTATRSN